MSSSPEDAPLIVGSLRRIFTSIQCGYFSGTKSSLRPGMPAARLEIDTAHAAAPLRRMAQGHRRHSRRSLIDPFAHSGDEGGRQADLFEIGAAPLAVQRAVRLGAPRIVCKCKPDLKPASNCR